AAGRRRLRGSVAALAALARRNGIRSDLPVSVIGRDYELASAPAVSLFAAVHFVFDVRFFAGRGPVQAMNFCEPLMIEPSAAVSQVERPVESECDRQPASIAGRPMVLHVRVITGRGGGPEKTILNSPRFLRRLGYESKLAYLHPPGDPGFESIRQRGQSLEAEVLSVPDRGPFDVSVIRRLIRICREERVAI